MKNSSGVISRNWVSATQRSPPADGITAPMRLQRASRARFRPWGLRPKPQCDAACRLSLRWGIRAAKSREAGETASSVGRSPVSDKVYDVPAEWAKRAWVNEAQYEDM